MIDSTMTAFQVHAWGEPPCLRTVPVPTPEPGLALVRIEAAAVTHLDLTVASGGFAMKPALPYVGGVEGAGVIVSSDRFAQGTKVTVRGAGLGTSPGPNGRGTSRRAPRSSRWRIATGSRSWR